MFKSKKFILPAVLAVVLAASVGGVALAADGEDTTTNPFASVWEKMAEVLNDDGVEVSSDQLQSAYDEAREDIREEGFQNFLDDQVGEGNITQEQADAYRNWNESKPDMGENFGPRARGRLPGKGGMRFEFKMQGPEGFGRFGRMWGSGGLCPGGEDCTVTVPEATTN